jgi:Ca-activated chloride channel family protein
MKTGVLLKSLVIVALMSSWAITQEPGSPPKSADTIHPVRLSMIVIDHSNHSIDKLSKDAIELLEDGVPQTVTSLSKDNRPADYAVAIDTTGSVRDLLKHEIEAVQLLINQDNPANEIFIERFVSSSKIETVQEFTSDRRKLIDALDTLYVEEGQSAVIDGVYLAVKHVAEHRPSPDRRRAVVVITDGEDRNSYYNESRLLELIRATDVQVFVVGIVDLLDDRPRPNRPSSKDAAEKLLTSLARESGGRVFFPKNVKEVRQAVTEILHDLNEQFLMVYQSTGNSSTNNFRKIALKIPATRDGQDFKAVIRPGYFLNPPELESLEKEKKKKKKSE